MRTRSQQQSPGGFVSLESVTRRTRSTRSASQTNSICETSEPLTEPPTRSKSQRVTKTTSKKLIKTQPKKAPKRVTRQSTRKAAKSQSADEEYESHDEQRPEPTPEDTNHDDKENHRGAPQMQESATTANENPLSEQNSSEKTEAPSPQHLPTQNTKAHETTGTTNPPELPQTSQDIPSKLEAHISVETFGASWTEFLFGDISYVGSPVSERSRTPSIDEPLFTIEGELDKGLSSR
ncbi:hypothetical protein EYZ11_000301 [Aspergillus tanneri]|uniref:Uncharacterized protein n=1 Tax=Aspergillus tanneri TaxID=1220188 RepID=A0A4V3UQT4_9EURO|nr:uncharacterized protein ATNIH1004_007864 [Aspergillus tanneri]KAA8646434.1 hypothetical protein ATNIH1004_007864 [Aspergillus tanneri]THD00251.1 hypothetical protein EYZ11_000301 [Aspergillus tanneri]